MKEISVIIPCYNVEPFLDRCISSLVHQTIGLDKLELIFINDASTDHTLDSLMHYEQQYPDDIMVINCEQNGKQGAARNIGMQYASCKYIGFVDADDWIEPTMYEKLYQKTYDYDYDIVSCQSDRVFKESDILPSVNGGHDQTFIIHNDAERLDFLNTGIGPIICTKIYRKSLLLENNLFFPEGLAYEDNYWGSLVSYYVNSAYKIDEILYHWYINPESTTMKRNNASHFDRLTIEEMKLNELKARGFYERFSDHIKIEFMKMYYFNSLKIFFRHFDEVPIAVFHKMQETFKCYVPDYKTYYDYTDIGKILVELVDLNISQTDLNNIQKLFLEKGF